MAKEGKEGRAIQLANWVIECGIEGFGPVSGAAVLAREYLADGRYADDDERVWSMIKWETSKNATTGFASGLGGIATLPVSVPAGFGAAWFVQARLAAGIASVYGFDLSEDRVRTLILISTLGDAGLKQPIKAAGVTVTQKLVTNGIKAVPRSMLTKINQAVGMRLLTKTGRSGYISLTKFVPVLGGVVGGTIDALGAYGVGKAAQAIFSADRRSAGGEAPLN